ncbi:putative histone chaperone ASF1A [Cucumis melo var. makuwa]|uniref:Putative histone chaperone ASF1A n=1 Tax=Cucumis melo var. makuwa TaxID=1194695 RepID=A0A5D3BX60_CUCMM|nr:putative histone chaperone ASF1A [Cucumis melo var. makuwa]
MTTDWSYSVTFRCAYSSVFHISQTVLMELGHNGSLWIGTNKALIDILAVYSVDLEWKLIYVGSAEVETYDQLLECVLVGPVNVGNYRFVLQADPPDPSKIPEEDIIGVTVLLLTCSYMGQEFIRVGYYVNNDYDDEQLREEPPAKVLIDRVQRNILSDKPRVTKFPINFYPETNDSGEEPPSNDPVSAETDGDEQLLASPEHPSNDQNP